MCLLLACHLDAGSSGAAGSQNRIDPVGAQVTGLRARHQAGQTILTWNETDPLIAGDVVTVGQIRQMRAEIRKDRRLIYRIYRSATQITSVNGMTPIGEALPLTAWNADYHGEGAKPETKAFRYVVDEGKEPVPPGTGIFATNPPRGGAAFYAVTAVAGGRENPVVSPGSALQAAVMETVGAGAPVLQRVEKPAVFNYVESPTLHYYVRWESSATSSVPGKPFDYVVGIPPAPRRPAPVGLHLHAWGGTLNEGYGWWFSAAKGAMLVATNQDPYDWWTGYHEAIGTDHQPRSAQEWRAGVVRPYTQQRVLAFLDWVATKYEVDLRQTFTGGMSMGGSGSLMLAIRYPERFAWAISWVGVHTPLESPTYKSSYELVYGAPELGVRYEDGSPVWEYYDDAAYLRRHPDRHVPFLTFSNGKNDSAIGWPQAVRFLRALQDTRQPHIFTWGQAGHGQRAFMPRAGGEQVMPLELEVNQSVPAFTNSSLDDDPGDGAPERGAPSGQVNLYLDWNTEDIVDEPARWEMTVGVIKECPSDSGVADLTVRRAQRFKLAPGDRLTWQNVPLGARKPVQEGSLVADKWGLVTLPRLEITKQRNRIRVTRAAAGTR